LRARLSLFFLLALIGAAGEPLARPVRPIDQARNDRDLSAMRDQLAEAVARKDIRAVSTFIASDATIGTGNGMQALVAWFRRDPMLWDELGRALALGGRMLGPLQFEAPYTRFVRERGVPYEELGVVIGRGIPVHETPTERGQVIARYTHETAVVKRWWVANVHADTSKEEAASADPWVEIQLPSKRRGYVPKRWVRWVGALRVSFAKRGGNWVVTRIESGN
jgi:hypothetical protein